jgi:hypothetical protein
LAVTEILKVGAECNRTEKWCLVINIETWQLLSYSAQRLICFIYVCVAYLTTLLKTLDSIALNDTLIMNNELERMWMEMIMA